MVELGWERELEDSAYSVAGSAMGKAAWPTPRPSPKA
jgi:hypothetical protein